MVSYKIQRIKDVWLQMKIWKIKVVKTAKEDEMRNYWNWWQRREIEFSKLREEENIVDKVTRSTLKLIETVKEDDREKAEEDEMRETSETDDKEKLNLQTSRTSFTYWNYCKLVH